MTKDIKAQLRRRTNLKIWQDIERKLGINPDNYDESIKWLSFQKKELLKLEKAVDKATLSGIEQGEKLERERIKKIIKQRLIHAMARLQAFGTDNCKQQVTLLNKLLEQIDKEQEAEE